jgi:hypothetical protein
LCMFFLSPHVQSNAQSTYAFFLIHWLSLLFSSVFNFRGFHMQTSKAKVYPVNETDTPSDLKDRKEEDFIDIKDMSVIKPL